MALRILEGFDAFTSRNDLGVVYPGCSFTNFPGLTQPGRNGLGGSLSIAGAAVDIPLGAAMDYVVAGVACSLSGNVTSQRTALSFLNASSTVQASLAWDTEGYPVLIIGASQVTGAVKIAESAYRYVEAKLAHSSGTLTMTLRIDEQVVASLAVSASAPQVTKLRLGTGDSSNTGQYDDLYVCDGSGSTHKDFLGDIAVRTSAPTGSSSTAGWTVTGAATAHEAVDDLPAINLADYTANLSTNIQIMFSFAALAADATSVEALKVFTISQRTDGFSSTIQARVDSNQSATQTLDASAHGYHFIYSADPAGGAWTLADITGHDYGLKII